jgi:hypothetical protein
MTRREMTRETAFINKLRAVNQRQEVECCSPFYSINPVVETGEQFIEQMRRAIANLPLEEEGEE